jgi:TatD DNase family protein
MLCTPWGIGELGLDYARAKDPAAREHQARVFRAQLALSRELELPIVIHCVRAYEEIFRLLKADGISRRGGMIHGWSGHPDALPTAQALGLMISFSSLFTRSKKVAQAARQTPIDGLLLETDSPDQPLEAGTRNEPAALVDIAQRLAELRAESARELLQAGLDNATRLFGLEG